MLSADAAEFEECLRRSDPSCVTARTDAEEEAKMRHLLRPFAYMQCIAFASGVYFWHRSMHTHRLLVHGQHARRLQLLVLGSSIESFLSWLMSAWFFLLYNALSRRVAQVRLSLH